jgi:hypothetical protein
MCDPKRRYDAKNNQADRVIAIERSLWRPLVSRHWEFGAPQSDGLPVLFCALRLRQRVQPHDLRHRTPIL